MTSAAACLAGLALLGASSAGCEGVVPEPDFDRMIVQRNARAYEASARFADGRAMRPPPEGTVSRARVLGQPALTTGIVEGRYVERLPVAVDRDLLERGRDRFDNFCAACHGLRGDGVSPVAAAMRTRKPPSLLGAPVAAFPPGRVFAVASDGYGLMPSYSAELSLRDRWAVVAYLGALNLSQDVALDRLPADLRAAAARALP